VLSIKPQRAVRSIVLGFGLRTLFVIFLVFAGLFAWIGDDVIRSRVQRPVIARIEADGGDVYFDYQVKPSGIHPETAPPGSWPVRSLFGDDIYATATSVFFYNVQPSDKVVKSLEGLPGLRDVAINGPGITDACVEDLLQIRRLRGLNLFDTSISPDGMAKLGTSRTLQQLTLYGSSVTDEHLAQLSEYPNLKILQIIRASITDDGLRRVGEIHGLKKLDIYQCNAITDTGILALDRLTDLERLHIVQSAQTDASMKAIAKMHRLRELRLDGSITDIGFRQLGSLDALEDLCLRDTDVGDGALATISQFEHLKFLDLWGTQISDAGLLLLSTLNELISLDLAQTQVTNRGLQQLVEFPSLASLSVQIGTGVTLEGVDKVRSDLPDCSVSCWDLESDGSGSLLEMR
jgi:hypothetical protein